MSIKDRSIPNYHEGWVEQKDTWGSWKRQWLALKGNELLLFTTGKRGEKPVWKAVLHEGTEVKTGKSGENSYQFVLKSEKKQFRCQGENDRDLWVAYIDGLAHGDFERSNKLLPGQKTSVDAAIENWRMLQTWKSRNPSQTDEGIGSEFSGEGSGDSLSGGGPIKNHKFYNDTPGQQRQQVVPSWFFEDCSRQLSEMILEKGKEYGNVLMRESVTFKDNGSYVISLRRDSPRGSECEHFEVIQTAAGYQINVENIHHPCRCLQDVMDYFLQAAGASYTCPFITNDLATLGIHRPHYQSVIQSVAPVGPAKQSTRPGISQTVSVKRQNYHRSSTMPSLTMFGRSSQSPMNTETTPGPPSSLRDVMRRGWSPEEKTPLPYVSSRPPAPLPSQATTLPVPPQTIPTSPPPVPVSTQPVPVPPLPVPISTQHVPLAPPPIPAASQPATPAPNSLEAQIAAKANLMSQNRRSSLPISSALPPAPVTPAVPAAPPPPPIPAAPAPPLVSTAPPPPPAPPTPPAPQAPSVTHGLKTPEPSPPMVPPNKPGLVASPPQSLQIGGQQVVFPKLKPTKTPPPPTKPKTRRSSEGDVQTPKSVNLEPSSVSGIIEEDHRSVRDVLAMFNSGEATGKTKQPIAGPTNVTSPQAPHPQETATRNIQGEEFKRRLESLFSGVAIVPLKSPTAAPTSDRLTTPLPPTPSAVSQPNQDNIYSEPGI